MKVAVTSDDASSISPAPGRCRGFVVFELVGHDLKRVEFRPNRDKRPQAYERGANRDADAEVPAREPSIAAVSDCQALVTRTVGPRLYADLTVQGIAPYLCSAQNVQEAAAQFARGELFRVRGRDDLR